MKSKIFIICAIVLTVGLSLLSRANANQQPTPKTYYNPADHVYQYAIQAASRTVYLWIPPDCKQVKGVIISLSNLLERQWLEDPLIRKTASDIGLGIIWVGPAQNGDQSFTADMKPGMEVIFQQMMDALAKESGYDELKTVPVIPMGHSANGHFAWTFANAFPDRTIAAIPIKTIPLPDTLRFRNIPLCYIVGETTEWPQYRVPDPATKPGDRDFYWPVVRKSALALRRQNPDNLISVVTDPGGGHFDWSARLAQFVALYIRKACLYRLPAKGDAILKSVNKASGWLTGNGGMVTDEFVPAPYAKFKGKPTDGYWFFDKEMALAAAGFEGDRLQRKKQMPTFIQDGQLVPVAKLGYAPLKFVPEQDGLSFKLTTGFLPAIPPELIGSGQFLGHAEGPINLKLITGPATQTGPNSFRLQFDRRGMGGEIWIQAEQAGDAEYRHAVQPGMLKIPSRLTIGSTQQITFNQIPDQKPVTKTVKLQANSTAGLPVDYYVVAGPAYVERGLLYITPIPVKSKFPIKITVAAYQWGRSIAPLFQSAEPVVQTFFINR